MRVAHPTPRELGYAAITSNFVNPDANENDVTGLQISFVAGSLPFYVEWVCQINNGTTGQGWTAKIKLDSGAGFATAGDSVVDAALNSSTTVPRTYRTPRQIITAGTTVTYKCTVDTVASGTLTVHASATRPCFLRAYEVLA